jgi:hypothetical protein
MSRLFGDTGRSNIPRRGTGRSVLSGMPLFVEREGERYTEPQRASVNSHPRVSTLRTRVHRSETLVGESGK